jgi:hypothetical protein
MTQSDRPSEDILGLFQKFDGDAHVYKEFSESVAPVAPVAVLAPVAPAPTARPTAPRVPAPPAAAPEAAVPQPAAARQAPPTTELERLFTRLAESTPSSASPMARWRVGLK